MLAYLMIRMPITRALALAAWCFAVTACGEEDPTTASNLGSGGASTDAASDLDADPGADSGLDSDDADPGTETGAAGAESDAHSGGDSAPEPSCAPLDDVTELIDNGKLFFGYAALGSSEVELGCGDFANAAEVAVSFTPSFSGDLVLTTQHPTTKLDTVLEVRDTSCEGASIGCSANTTPGLSGSRLSIQVQAGKTYVALVETADDQAGVFAIGLHRPGVCDGRGSVQDITSQLLSGSRFATDPSSSTSSLRGSCSTAADHPEARLSFIAPRTGTIVATAVHPQTVAEPLLHVRRSPYCDSTEAELACGAGSELVRFDALAEHSYDLFVDGDGAATVTIGYGATSPSIEALNGCKHATIQDQFAFLVQAGQVASLAVDTVDAQTAADTRMRIRLPDGTELHEADDDVPCTFAPPKYSCPQYTFTAATSGLYTVEVYVGSSESCYDHSRVNYELTVNLDGQPSELVHIKDQ